ncbi:hypothetical protein [Methylocystis sp. B8]|uniref:hypothetical protein n=1 Tax=Methylocystis sp. B8 TaxID=544938 RepID=UPI0014859CF7|nr:hypothetical protein [Methylocystis sp. B8]
MDQIVPRDAFESGLYGDPFLTVAIPLHPILQSGAGVGEMTSDVERIRAGGRSELLDHADADGKFM